jgi:hypothetical protein
MAKIRSKHSELLNYFIYDDKDLSKEYVPWLVRAVRKRVYILPDMVHLTMYNKAGLTRQDGLYKNAIPLWTN